MLQGRRTRVSGNLIADQRAAVVNLFVVKLPAVVVALAASFCLVVSLQDGEVTNCQSSFTTDPGDQ